MHVEQGIEPAGEDVRGHALGQLAKPIVLVVAEVQVAAFFGCHGDQRRVAQQLEQLCGELVHLEAGVMHLCDGVEAAPRLTLHQAREHLVEQAAVHQAQQLGDLAILDLEARERDHLVQEALRVAHGALTGPGHQAQRVFADLDALRLADGGQAARHLTARDALEVEALDAGEDGVRDLLGFGGGEHEDHVRRRLLEGLEQRVEGLPREHVDFVDDVDAVAGM